MRLSLIILTLCISSAAVAAAQPASPSGRERLTSDQIAELIRKLDADAFAVREAATARLAEAGEGAIPLIVDAVEGNNLEVTSRLIRVLGDLALSDDMVTERAAREALTKIADTRVTSAASRAADTLATLIEVREDRALEQLRRLGAMIEKHTYPFTDGSVDLSYSLEIDKRWKGGDADAELLRYVPHVRHLTLDGPMVNDEWIQHIPHMAGLHDITIARGQITAAGLEPLRSLDQLKTVHFMYVPIDDEAVEVLGSLRGLHYMKLFGTKLSKEGEARLTKLLENTALDVRRGGFLGIGAAPNAPQCTISDVHAGTAADQAGLLSGDIILKYDGKAVTDFDSLTALISENSPGDTVAITVRRENQELEKQVTLGEWKLKLD